MKKIILFAILFFTISFCASQPNPKSIHEIALQHAIDTLVSKSNLESIGFHENIVFYKRERTDVSIKSFVSHLVNLYQSGYHFISEKELLETYRSDWFENKEVWDKVSDKIKFEPGEDAVLRLDTVYIKSKHDQVHFYKKRPERSVDDKIENYNITVLSKIKYEDKYFVKVSFTKERKMSGNEAIVILNEEKEVIDLLLFFWIS